MNYKRRLIMSKLLAALLLITTSTAAFADGHFGGHGGGYGGGYHGGYGHYENHYHGGGYGNFVGPALIGGVIGYALAQPRYYEPTPQVIYQQPPVVVTPGYSQLPRYQNCTAWTETIDQYGNTTKTRTCY
jgi:hypothetical protein